MRYRASIDGRTIGSGAIQDATAWAAQAVGHLVAQDPGRAAAPAAEANRAFSEGAVEGTVRAVGRWTAEIGGAVLRVRGAVRDRRSVCVWDANGYTETEVYPTIAAATEAYEREVAQLKETGKMPRAADA